ncbi:MAG: GmrSD restriction endonuclease domain-containing protein [Arenimonas sp.]
MSKITPSSPRLASLLSDVERGNVKIPVFQRQYIWSDEQIISLLDSIYRGSSVRLNQASLA